MAAAELGQTSDPRALVPGDPAVLHAHAAELTTHGSSLEQVGGDLRRIDTFDAWSGKAGEAFSEKFTPHPAQWLTAADSHQAAASAVSRYADTLTWAQGQAGSAAQQFDQAQAATQIATAQYNQAAERGAQQAPFVDPGAAARDNAQGLLARAREQLAGAGDGAARAVTAAADDAPQQSMLASFTDDLEDVGGRIMSQVGPALTVAAGAGLTALSVTGELAGVVLDVVPGGAIAGVPLNVISAGGIVAGVGMMAAGMAWGKKNADDFSRPSGFRKGVRDTTWENGKKPDGKVYDPKTKRELKKDEPWDMGHKPGDEFRRHQQDARERGDSRKKFLDDHNDPNRYRPEDPSSNRSRTEEDKSGR